jgi:hypothetical protein
MSWSFRHAALVAALCMGCAAAPPAGPPAPVELIAGGLRTLPAKPGAHHLLAFGTAKPATIAALTRALGRPPGKRGANAECGGGPQTFVTWEGALTLWFSEEEGFVGWESRGKLATAQGIAIGSPRAALRVLRGIEVAQTSLGTEFTAGELDGLLSSKARDAKVRALWSGSTCVFR